MARPDPSGRPVDPVRLIGLLWTPSSAVGRSGVTVGAVTEAAIRLADAEGLESVTMRRLADDLGVGAMTLYTYVPGRTELVELMLDRVAGQVYPDRAPVDAPDWRGGMERVVEANWAYLMAHPWTVDVPPGRPVLGPGVSTKYELELAPLDGIGLTDLEMNNVLTAVVGLVTYSARWYLTLDRVRSDTALTDEQWWHAVGPSLGAAIAASGATFPLAGRVGTAVGEALSAADDPEGAMRYGVERLLDGVAARLAG